MKSNWTIAQEAPETFFRLFEESRIVVQLLWNRDIRTIEKAEIFLHPDLERDLYDPFLFTQMQKAVDRIRQAFDRKEKIAIWGDYDCDGVCGTTILFTLFRELGYEDRINVHIPDRNTEGYGLTMPHLEELVGEGIALLITVDCGITSVKEIAWAEQKGINVIVADHHSVPEMLPPACAILNPKDPRSGYPFSGLAGTGVAFKLASALLASLKTINYKLSTINYLDLAALATLADAMPLRDENRALVKFGLEQLAATTRVGLQKLLQFCELEKGFSVRDVHFSLIPRINAMGRMEHASTSFRLLATQSEEEAATLIRHIDERNRERQMVTDIIAQEVLERLAKLPQKPPVVFESAGHWTPGVLGLAAQRIMNEVNRPVILAVIHAKTGRVTGNARALGAFNIVDILHSRPELFTDAGGHPHAGGFSTTVEHLEEIRNIFLQAGAATEAQNGFFAQDAVTADIELQPNDVTWQTFAQVQQLAPFGEGNPEPQFLLRGLAVITVRSVGNGAKHLKLRLKLPANFFPGSKEKFAGSFIDAIGFGLGTKEEMLKPGKEIDVIAKLSENNWNGRKSLELQVVDLDISRISQ